MKLVEATIIFPVTILLIVGLISYDTDCLYDLSYQAKSHKEQLVKIYEKSNEYRVRIRDKISNI